MFTTEDAKGELNTAEDPARKAAPANGAPAWVFARLTGPAWLAAVLWARKGLILLAALLGGVLVGSASLLIPPKYVSTAQLFIDPRDLRGLQYEISPNAVGSDPTSITAYLESQARIIASDSIKARVVQREGLDKDPEFGAASGGLFGILGSGGESEQKRARLHALAALSRNVAVRRGERSFVIDISVTSRDPDKAARIANTLANAYLDDQAAVRAEAAQRATAALTWRLDELRTRLRAADDKAERYKEANNLVGVGGRTIGEEQLALNAQLVALRTKVSEARSKYEQSRATRASSIESGSIPEAVASSAMTALRAQLSAALNREADLLAILGARHPARAYARLQVRDARRQITDELARITRAAKIDYDRAADAERQIAARVEELKTQQYAAGRASVELRELEREVESARAVYDAFLRRVRETGEQSGIDTTNARVISEAMPPLEKSGISRRNLALLGAVAGGGVGALSAIALALLAIPLPAREAGSPRRRNFWRRRSETVAAAEAPPAPEPAPPVPAPAAEPPPARFAANGNGSRRFMTIPGGRATPPAESAPALTVPVLGTLPVVRNRRWRLGDRELRSVFQAKVHLVDSLDKPQAGFARAIRDIGATVARQEGRHRHILVAGLRREAGASTLALNLALDAALAGQPAMLIDAGLGSNSLTAVFVPEARSGLQEVVSGAASLARAALQDEGTGLFFLARKGQPERLTAEQIGRDFFTAARRFSPIVIDGAALGSDRLTEHFAEAVDDIVLVIRDSALRPADLAQAQRLLGRNAAKLRGIVLNAA